ncbi:uncharacterized protein [Montipora capricornis]|uniref:uncharacterized protein n=1 Tax=Montipora capricornis TaxID=246305 RepID=UPI0035F1779D
MMTGLVKDQRKSSLQFEEEEHDTLKHLNTQRHSRILCDVVLMVDDEEFPAHKGVLAANSNFFLAMFTTDMLEKGKMKTCINCVSAEAMGSLLEFMYTGRIHINLDNVLELLEASNFLSIVKVKKACCQFLENIVDLENCLAIRSIADVFCCDGLSRVVTKYIHQKFLDVSKTEAFMKSGEGDVMNFLSSDDIKIDSEEQVLEILLDWINYDPERRKCYKDELLKLVRLQFIPASRLQDLKQVSWPLTTTETKQTWKSTARKYYSNVEVIAVTGGCDGSTFLSTVYCFIPAEKKWMQLPDMQVPRWRHQVVVCDDNLLVIGGLRDVCVKEPISAFVEMFSGQTNVWVPVPQQPAVRDIEIDSFGAVSTGSRVLVVGGIDSKANKCTSSVYSIEFGEDTSRVVPLSSLLVPRAGHCLVTIGDCAYTIGGFQTPFTHTPPDGLKVVECYDLEGDAWNVVQPMNERRVFAAAVAFKDKIFVFGGSDGDNILSSCEVYDPELNQWQTIAPMLVPRMRHSAVVHKDKIYVIGGLSAREGPGLKSVECYVFEENRWTKEPDMPSGSFDHQSNVVNVGYKLVVQAMEKHDSGSPCNIINMMTGLVKGQRKSSLQFEEEGHDTLKLLNTQRHSGILCDVVLMVDGEEFPVHKGVLAANSNFFLAMFTTDMLEKGKMKTCINCVSAEAMGSLLEFMYTGRIHINLDNVLELLEASNFLSVVKVKKACCQFLENIVDLENCLAIRSIADVFCCDGLSRVVTKYIHQKFLDVSKTEAFMTSGEGDVMNFLSSDDIKIDSEEQVLEILLDWINYDPERRKCYKDELLKLVRLQFIPASRLQDLKQVSWPLTTTETKQTWKSTARKYYSNVEVIAVTGGCDGSTFLSTVYCFIPAEKKWMQLPDMQIPRWRHQVVVYDDNLLVIGGLRDVCVKEPISAFVEMFSGQTNVWVPVPQQPAVRDIEIDSFGAVSTASRVLVVGGIDSKANKCTSSVYSIEFGEDTSRIVPLSSLLVPRAGHCLVTIGKCAYTIGGFQTPFTHTPDGLQVVECYDLQEDAWNVVQPMNERRLFAAAVAFKNKIFVFGGSDGDNILSSCEVYDPELNQWQTIAPMLVPRMRHSAVVHKDKIYVIGGLSAREGPGLKSVECYVSEENRWTKEPDMPSGRFDHQSNVANVGYKFVFQAMGK